MLMKDLTIDLVAEPRPISSMLTPTLGILSAVVVLLCMGGVIAVVFLRRQCQQEEVSPASANANNNPADGSVAGSNSSGVLLAKKMNRNANCNPSRSQSLKPLVNENVMNESSLGSQLLATRMGPDRWKDHLLHHSSITHHLSSLELAWPVGEPPPSLPPPPPPPKSIEPGLITPPYTTDSSLELRSPDIIPPPSIGKMKYYTLQSLIKHSSFFRRKNYF